MSGVTVLYGDKGYMFHKGSNVAKKIDAWIQKDLRYSQYRGCTVAHKENNVYTIYMKPRRNKIDAMPLSGDSESGELPAGSEPVRLENPDPGGAGGAPIQKFQEEHTTQCETMWMVTRQVQDRSPNNCVASKGRAHAHSSREDGELPEIGIDYGFFGCDREDGLPILCVRCRNSSTGCVGATVVDRKGASDYASSFLTAFIKSLRILVRSDNERSLLSLIERVTSNLTGVELVLMTS